MNWQDLPLISTLQGHMQLTETLIAVVDAPWACYQGHYYFEIHRQEPLPPLERAVAGVLLHAGPQSLEALGQYLGLLVTQDPDQLLFLDPAEYQLLRSALSELGDAEMIEEVDLHWQLTSLGEEFAPLFCKPTRIKLDATLLLGADAQEDTALAHLRTHLDSAWSPTYLTMLTDRARLTQALVMQYPDDFRPGQGDRLDLVIPQRLERQTLDRVVAVLHQAQPPFLRLLPCLRRDDRYDVIQAPPPGWDALEDLHDRPLGLPPVADPTRLMGFAAALAEKGAALPPVPDSAAISELDAWLLGQDFLHFPHFLQLLPRLIPANVRSVCLCVPHFLRALIPQIQAMLTAQADVMHYLVVEAEPKRLPPQELENLIAICADPKRKLFLLLQDPTAKDRNLTFSLLIETDAGVHGWQGCEVETHVPPIGNVTWPILERRSGAAILAQADAVRKEVSLHHLTLLHDEGQKLSHTGTAEDVPRKTLDQLSTLTARADLLGNFPDAAVKAAHATLRDQYARVLAHVHARWTALWAAERQPLCAQPLRDSRAAQTLRQQIREHKAQIQATASPWPDFYRQELAAAEAAFQPMWDAFEALPKTWVADTNVLLRQPDLLAQLPADDRIALPHIVLEELDKQKNKRDLGKAARQAIAALEEALGQEKDLPVEARRVQVLNAHLNKMPDGYRNPIPDHHVLAVAYQLLPARPIVLLTEDKNLRAKAKALDIPSQGMDPNPGLPAPPSTDGPDWAALYRRTKRQKDGRVHIDDFMLEVRKAQPKLDLKALGFLTPAAFVKSLPGFSIRNQNFIHLSA